MSNPDAPDYLSMLVYEEVVDALQYGIKGMKWGIRRSKAQLAAASSGGDSSSTQKSDGPETSSQRYARLRSVAREGKAGGLSDEDLKWFNSRTEALSKINKLNQSNPGWLKKTIDDVLKKVAKDQIESVAKTLANKHVSGPINEALTSKQKKAIEEAIRKGIEDGVKKAVS